MSAEDQGYTDGGPNPYYIGDCKYCALKAGMIDELEKCGEHRQGIIEIQETHIAELAQQLAALKGNTIAKLDIEASQLAARNSRLEQQLAELRGLLSLIRDDLLMRSEDGVVDLSDFIWRRMDKALQESSDQHQLTTNKEST